MKDSFKCSKCGEVKPVHKDGGTGYGLFGKSKRKVCYACCAELDKLDMVKTGKALLYLSHHCGLQPANALPLPQVWTVSNWPGTLKFNAHVRVGAHNIAGKRYDAWFKDHTGRNWHGVTIGDNTQICHCRRLAA